MYKWILALLGTSVIFASGYFLAYRIYTGEIAKIQLQASEQARKAQLLVQEIERGNNEKLVQAINERDQALRSNDDLLAELNRLRVAAKNASNAVNLPEANNASCKSERELLAQSTKLIKEGAELLYKCQRLANESSANNDAIVKLIK